MGTSIPYVDETLNFMTGCTKCSPGCLDCFAEELHNTRHKAYLAGKKLPTQYAKPFSEIQLFPTRLDKPLHWRKPRKILTCSMGDLFHPKVPFEFIDKVFATMALCPQHEFMLLTKRVDRMAEYFKGNWLERVKNAVKSKHYDMNVVWPGSMHFGRKILLNLHLGLTICNQPEMDKKGSILLSIPAAHHWISFEPLLEDVDVSYRSLGITCPECGGKGEITDPEHWMHPNQTGDGEGETWCLDCNNLTTGINGMVAGIDFVVIGCESGPNRRPCKREWIQNLVNQCEAAGVKYMVKQMAENEDGTGKVIHDLEWIKAELGD